MLHYFEAHSFNMSSTLIMKLIILSTQNVTVYDTSFCLISPHIKEFSFLVLKILLFVNIKIYNFEYKIAVIFHFQLKVRFTYEES